MKEKQNDICLLISEIMEEDYKLFELSSNLIDDIHLDSMGFLELSIQIQRKYGIIITNEEWLSIKTLSDLIATIEKKKNEL